MHAVFRRRSSPWPFWALAFALLLKAALPLVAATAAGAQQRPLAEVCSVYGIATVAVMTQAGGDGAFEHGELPPAHHADACPLLALAAFGTAPDAAPAALLSVALGAAPAAGTVTPHPPDAITRWAMRLKHGPPAAA